MNNWKEFVEAEPLLLRVEENFQRYQRILRMQRLLPPGDAHEVQAGIDAARQAMVRRIRRDMQQVGGKVSHWMYPYYEGDFMVLVAALGYCGLMDQQRDDRESRRAFAAFYQSVPPEVHAMLLNPALHPDARKVRPRERLRHQAMLHQVKTLLDTFYAN